MSVLTESLVAIIAVMHFGFLVLEMFLWTKPLGLKVFRNSSEKAKSSAVLAANRGLYNGFLAAGLLWSLVNHDSGFAIQLQFFFLSCVLVAGIFGALSVSRRILYIQALPAAVGLSLLLLN